MSILRPINAEVNQFVADAKSPLTQLMLPYLSDKDLAMFQISCKAFRKVALAHEKSQTKLAWQRKLHLIQPWTSKTLIGFKEPTSSYCSAAKKEILPLPPKFVLKPFSMETVLKIARKLRDDGDVKAPAYSFSLNVPFEQNVSTYIMFSECNEQIYAKLLEVKKTPKGDGNDHFAGAEAFHGVGASTAIQKAEACERFVLESHEKSLKKPSNSSCMLQ